jgi:hypothetical protein
MSQVRFQVLFGPASLHPHRMEWAGQDTDDLDLPDVATVAGSGPRGHWYGWRLIGANNRELGRSARSFGSYPLARRAVTRIKEEVDRLVQHSATDPSTGRWGWRFELDGVAVAASGRWYERDHDSRIGAAKFVSLTPAAELVEGVVTLHLRRIPGAVHVPVGDPG